MDWKTFDAMVDSTPPRPIEDIRDIPDYSASFQFAHNSAGTAARRPQTQLIRDLHLDPDRLDDLYLPKSGDRITCFVRSNALKSKADLLFAGKNYADARSIYVEAASEMVAGPLPSSEFDSKVYSALGAREGWNAIDLMACINGAIESSRQLLDYDSALLWVEEAETLDKKFEAAVRASSFEWVQIENTSSDYCFERLTTLCLASEVFFALGNTGSAVYRRWLADELLYAIPRKLKTAQILDLAPLLGIDILSLKHPDPESAATLSSDHPNLQLCGSWKKLSIRSSSAPGARMGCATCAFDGQLYVLGGEKNTEGPFYRDFWVLDLEDLDGWRRLPDFPVPEALTGELRDFELAPHADGRIFVFVGWPSAISVFDTKSHKWGMMRTTFVHDAQMHEWLYRGLRVSEYTAHRKWRRLSGSAVPKPSQSSPGPRERCHSWVGKDKAHIFYMFGQSDRPAAEIVQQTGGPPFFSHAYSDLWSWDIKAEKWKRELLRGNVPSSCSEMACTYNPILDKVIVFGGYSPSVPTWLEDLDDIVTYSYYADTFIADASGVSPLRWKQVLTRGFPIYRAGSALVTDSRTGKTFLFGGYKNHVYVPSRSRAPQSSCRSFNDLWQLRLDLPGGFFDGVNLEEEARTAKVGPWQRCFTCGSAGPWKRCGGTCNGQAFFCESACLKDGWKEHKEKHGCRKA
ncbi:hypothetical protein DFH06DRAFT_1398480 [Mycena polygramma]|nr:hypothetical protein DFH06DRAFT_1398480 [Mycena polygramma]